MIKGGNTMKLTENELNIEKEYLVKTEKVIEESLTREEAKQDKMRVDTVAMKKFMWKRSNGLDFEEIDSYNRTVTTRIVDYDRMTKTIALLKRMKKAPYFGRIDFADEFGKEQVYIGISNVHDEDLNYFVYDWRAPISTLFYDSNLGETTYKTPKGKTKGKLLLKRQYKIINGELINAINSDNNNIIDEALVEAVNDNSSSKMKDIVNTIQSDQNAIIRNVIDPFMIIQGAAGSGKTSIALHRIAYLLYKNRDFISAKNVLILSPNDVFSEYISEVLPALGEDNVYDTTFHDFIAEFIKEFRYVESFTSYLERYYENTNEEELKELVFKQSDEFKREVDNYFYKLNQDCFITDDITVMEKVKIEESYLEDDYEEKPVIFEKEHLNKLFNNKFRNQTIVKRVELMAEYEIAHKRLAEANERDYRNMIFEVLSENIDPLYIYESLLAKFDYKINVKEDILSYEDALPLLYIKGSIDEFPYINYIKHVVIDECQDYTYMQFEMMKKMFKTASFTIVGDVNQAINGAYIYNSLNDLNTIFKKAKFIRLNKTYRSTKEITDYANSYIDVDDIISVRDSSSREVSRSVENIKGIANIINESKKRNKTIAVITKNSKEAKEVHELLSKETEVTLINNNHQKYCDNIVVIPSYFSKGLEFDHVISIDNDYSDNKLLYYVVLTRALHDLNIVKLEI